MNKPSVVFFVSVALSGCPAANEKLETRGSTASQPSPQREERSAFRRVSLDDVSGSLADKLDEARKAQKALGSMLVRELTTAVGKGDFARGVEVCRTAAPRIAKTVSDNHRVEIGRTSFKLRNPDNSPRGWAKPFVKDRVAEEVLLEGEDGRVAYMAPIRLGAVCVKCHGSSEEIPAEVKAQLAQSYPEDEALGFAPGDLRGWFWVELGP